MESPDKKSVKTYVGSGSNCRVFHVNSRSQARGENEVKVKIQ
ncbi:hypothetical protein CLOSTMETH_03002 [[Clostridium] methylpentosum DSM 5476]|uniref:Uncharacterized protein n=1 Tax=[Clostridium] methylpentosum DSM 5476 TaxID=537013 RepID=C0EGK9_9FIRM|nr:hypothetical protein CLOSTMETH_03002 [[Clostridium] methylpentosum DSM 5476]